MRTPDDVPNNSIGLPGGYISEAVRDFANMGWLTTIQDHKMLLEWQQELLDILKEKEAKEAKINRDIWDHKTSSSDTQVGSHPSGIATLDVEGIHSIVTDLVCFNQWDLPDPEIRIIDSSSISYHFPTTPNLHSFEILVTMVGMAIGKGKDKREYSVISYLIPTSKDTDNYKDNYKDNYYKDNYYKDNYYKDNYAHSHSSLDCLLKNFL